MRREKEEMKMKVFVDTSGFLAVLDADDESHGRAKDAWIKLLSSGAGLTTSNYVVVETCALLQSRFGMTAARVFQEDVLPVVRIEWVEEMTHRMAMSAFLAAGRRRLSLVDCVSFEIMRRLGSKSAFTVDGHFREHGFKCIP